MGIVERNCSAVNFRTRVFLPPGLKSFEDARRNVCASTLGSLTRFPAHQEATHFSPARNAHDVGRDPGGWIPATPKFRSRCNLRQIAVALGGNIEKRTYSAYNGTTARSRSDLPPTQSPRR
jgi:hypothetical protein